MKIKHENEVQYRRSGVELLFDTSLLLYMCIYFTGQFNSVINLLVSGIMLVAIVLLMCERRYLRIDTVSKWYTVFVLFALSSVFWAKDNSKVTELIITFVRTIIIGISINNRIRDKEDVKCLLSEVTIAALFRVIVVAFSMLSVYGVRGIFFMRFGDELGYNSNSTAVLAVFAILLSIYNIKNVKTHKWFYIFTLFILTFSVLLSRSKKGLFGLFIGLIIYLYYSDVGIKKIRNIIFGAATIYIFYLSIINIPFLYEGIGHRIEMMISVFTGMSSEMSSTKEREMLIRQGIEVWQQHKILGIGLNNFSLYQTVKIGYYAHCNYVELLADLGIIGTAIYYYLPLILLAKRGDRSQLSLVLKVIIVLILVFDFSMVSYQEFYFSIFFWLSNSYLGLTKINDGGGYYEMPEY